LDGNFKSDEWSYMISNRNMFGYMYKIYLLWSLKNTSFVVERGKSLKIFIITYLFLYEINNFLLSIHLSLWCIFLFLFLSSSFFVKFLFIIKMNIDHISWIYIFVEIERDKIFYFFIILLFFQSKKPRLMEK
jgi:hypothetical protein